MMKCVVCLVSVFFTENIACSLFFLVVCKNHVTEPHKGSTAKSVPTLLPSYTTTVPVHVERQIE